LTRAEQHGDDLIRALDWCDRQGIKATLFSLALKEGRPDMMTLLCRRLMRTLQQRREIESKARSRDEGRGRARVSEAQSVALFLAARMSQRCTERGIPPPAEVAALIDACRGEAIPASKGTKPSSRWSRAVYYVAANGDASLQQIANAVGAKKKNKMTISNWLRLPEFQLAVAKVRKDTESGRGDKMTATKWRQLQRALRPRER
jgi:hypothetical protein